METNEATQQFIRSHRTDDVRRLALQGAKDPTVDFAFALQQIAGWQKARQKIPSWAETEGILYPPHLSMEQCSSEQTARYKASMAGEGTLMVDLTAGFGVDMAFICPRFQRAVHVEQQPSLCEISRANYRLLGLDHVEVVCGDAAEYLHQMPPADLLFIDPARRDEHGGRTYGIADCTPNVLALRDEMLAKARRVMVKLSPMLDWRKAVEDLGRVSEVHIVSVNNECKELLLVLSQASSPLKLVCVNDGSVLEITAPQPTDFPNEPTAFLPEPATFLFEPNASVMKAGCFRELEHRFGVSQLDPNSHLFLSDRDVRDFPGRRFVIDAVTTMNKRELKAALQGVERANITVRNFPLSVAELRKRLRLKDGGDCYILATSMAGRGHVLLLCHKAT